MFISFFRFSMNVSSILSIVCCQIKFTIDKSHMFKCVSNLKCISIQLMLTHNLEKYCVSVIWIHVCRTLCPFSLSFFLAHFFVVFFISGLFIAFSTFSSFISFTFDNVAHSILFGIVSLYYLVRGIYVYLKSLYNEWWHFDKKKNKQYTYWLEIHW